MKYAAFILILAGCAAPIFKPVEVEIPVVASCADTPLSKQDFALSHVTAADDIAVKTKAALIELNQRRAYEAVLEACQ